VLHRFIDAALSVDMAYPKTRIVHLRAGGLTLAPGSIRTSSALAFAVDLIQNRRAHEHRPNHADTTKAIGASPKLGYFDPLKTLGGDLGLCKSLPIGQNWRMAFARKSFRKRRRTGDDDEELVEHQLDWFCGDNRRLS
jgi:hypothetical protein